MKNEKDNTDVCIYHFDPRFIRDDVKLRPRLIRELKHVPTIIVDEERVVVPNIKHSVSVLRKSQITHQETVLARSVQGFHG